MYAEPETARAEDPKAPGLPAAVNRLDKAVAEHDELLHAVATQLEPVLGPERPSMVDSRTAEALQSSPVVAHLDTIADRIESMTGVLRMVRSRLEV